MLEEPQNITVEQLMRQSAFQFVRDYANKYAVIGNVEYVGNNGNALARNQFYRKMKQEDILWDQLTLAMCADEREKGNLIPEWLLRAELDAWNRQRNTGYRRAA